jgi:lipopolysaccharide transport system permease protein
VFVVHSRRSNTALATLEHRDRRLRSLWQYRQFVWETALGDFRYRYAGSRLGVFWNVAAPLALLAIYTVVFSGVLSPRLAGGRLAEALFPLYLGSGFLPWAAFTDCLTRGTNALVTNAAYLKKMPIPEQVFVAQTAASATLGMFISFALLVALALVLGHAPAATWLLLPAVGVLWQAFGFGLALLFGAFNVFFRDLAQVLGVVLQIWMWSLPVVYLEEVLPDAYRATLPFNPAYPFLVTLREVFLYDSTPAWWMWVAMAAWAIVAISVGHFAIRALRADIRDQV